jgi:hypothetical protein
MQLQPMKILHRLLPLLRPNRAPVVLLASASLLFLRNLLLLQLMLRFPVDAHPFIVVPAKDRKTMTNAFLAIVKGDKRRRR